MAINTYKLTNESGMAVTVTNLGCAIINLEVPGKDGKTHDVVLGLDTAEDYITKPHPFFGVVAGRFANRIGHGKFTLDGAEYQLETNDGSHHLHGGNNGFDKKEWEVLEATANKIVFELTSPCGDGNYPGQLTARITYTLSASNTLRIDYNSTTSTKTICNLTNHSYFNLSGFANGNIFDHVLQMSASKITAVDAGLIPTGEFIDVTGTAFDFRKAKPIGQDIVEAGNLVNTGGYDHNFVLDNAGAVASVYSPVTGVRMSIATNSPGMQLYTGNMIPSGVSGKGAQYGKHSGFCLETQIFPDAINHAHFPSCVVESGQAQEFYTEFKFDIFD